MTSDPVVSPVVAAGRVRVSLIGAGAWARTAHLAALAKRDDVTFVGVYDPDPQRADETAREFGFANVASSVEELLAAPSDACIIASPAARHAEQAIASLEAGRHVLLEKPMSNSAVDSWRIADLAHSTELTVMLALGWNHSPVFAEASWISWRMVCLPFGSFTKIWSSSVDSWKNLRILPSTIFSCIASGLPSWRTCSA